MDLTGASRDDLAVRRSADSTLSVQGTVVAHVFADATLPADLTVGLYSNDASGTTWSAWPPAYLRDLRGVTSVEQRTVNMGARTINGNKFNMDEPTFIIPTGFVQDWTVKGAGAHPFHLHVYHFQIDGACGAFEDGEYYDTLSAGPCSTRFDLNPATSTVYDGTTIMHCHILDHEDQGAMGWSDIVGGLAPPSFPAAGFQELYPCVSAPPPTDCSVYLDRTSCNSNPACTWNGKTKRGVNR